MTAKLKTLRYEWDVELKDEHGDIIDHRFQASYADCVAEVRREQGAVDCDIVLVCTSANDDRGWAYLQQPSGRLPEFFEDAYERPIRRVPLRFHREVIAANSKPKATA